MAVQQNKPKIVVKRGSQVKTRIVKPKKVQARTGTQAPDWALKLAKRECNKSQLTLCWRWGGQTTRVHKPHGAEPYVIKSHRASYVSGTAYYGGKRVSNYGESTVIRGYVIQINAGVDTSVDYQKYVLLHEIAHINVGGGQDHNEVWQKELIRLVKKHSLLEAGLEHHYYGYECERKALQKAINRSNGRKKALEAAGIS